MCGLLKQVCNMIPFINSFVETSFPLAGQTVTDSAVVACLKGAAYRKDHQYKWIKSTYYWFSMCSLILIITIMDNDIIYTVFDILDTMFKSFNDCEKEELSQQIQMLLKNC